MKNILEKYAYKGEIVNEKEKKQVSKSEIEDKALKLVSDIKKFCQDARGVIDPKFLNMLMATKKRLLTYGHLNEESGFEISKDTLKNMSSSDKKELTDAISDTESDIEITEQGRANQYRYSVHANFYVFTDEQTDEAAEKKAKELLELIDNAEPNSDVKLRHVLYKGKPSLYEGRKLSKKEFLDEMKFRKKGYIIKESYTKEDFLKKHTR